MIAVGSRATKPCQNILRPGYILLAPPAKGRRSGAAGARARKCAGGVIAEAANDLRGKAVLTVQSEQRRT
eukprot:scaffold170448_cov23-Tisochrysis_lutea.AAC.3